MDEESYSLLLRLYHMCKNLCFILVVGQDSHGSPAMPFLDKPRDKGSANFQIYDDAEIAKTFAMNSKVYETQQLSSEDFRAIVLDLA